MTGKTIDALKSYVVGAQLQQRHRKFEAWVDEYLGHWARKGYYDQQGAWQYKNPVVTRLFELFPEDV